MQNIQSIHLEITEKCNASCLQCDRNKNGGEVNQYLKNNEITLDFFKSKIPKNIIKNLKKLYMCGNYGDPVVANDTLEIFQYLRSINPTMNLQMITNASAQDSEWWSELAKANVKVRFSVDGLEDTNHLYRQGTDFNKIIENAKIFIDNGGYAIWDYLVFGHNEHQVQEAKELSETLGFKEFIIKKTGRFFSNIKNSGKEQHQGINKKGEKTQTLTKPSEKYQNNALKKEELLIQKYGSLDNYLKQTEITCKTLQQNEIYISAEGLIFPCCWLAGQMYKWYWKPEQAPIWKMIEDKKNISLHYDLLENIVNGKIFKKIQNSWTNSNRLKVCSLKCGKEFDPFNEQYS